MKRRLIVTVVAYGLTWIVLAGLLLLGNHICGTAYSLWIVTYAVAIGAFGDWFGGWIKSRQP